ncbi:unnamed protein product [Ciceribacter sp. T2.26MG-112.2]|nr:unnamed protein product [Ciceribacter naphthalenivorans]
MARHCFLPVHVDSWAARKDGPSPSGRRYRASLRRLSINFDQKHS